MTVYGTVPSDRTPSNDGSSDSEGGQVQEDYYITNHTEYRPPHLNNRNFSSTQASGSNTSPRRAGSGGTDNTVSDSMPMTDGGDGNYTYEPSSYTDVTLKPSNAPIARPDLDYLVNYDYGPDGGPQLTAQAMAFHNLNNQHGYNGNVQDWEAYHMRYVDLDADSGFDLSTSNLDFSSGPQSQASTTNNYVMVLPPPEHPSAELFRDIGSLFGGTATQIVLARDIADEDTVDGGNGDSNGGLRA